MFLTGVRLQIFRDARILPEYVVLHMPVSGLHNCYFYNYIRTVTGHLPCTLRQASATCQILRTVEGAHVCIAQTCVYASLKYLKSQALTLDRTEF
jgi:hypothetical protein